METGLNGLLCKNRNNGAVLLLDSLFFITNAAVACDKILSHVALQCAEFRCIFLSFIENDF